MAGGGKMKEGIQIPQRVKRKWCYLFFVPGPSPLSSFPILNFKPLCLPPPAILFLPFTDNSLLTQSPCGNITFYLPGSSEG